jgi:xanthine dehydrogenase small subunit
MNKITFTLNGQRKQVVQGSADMTVLEYLRNTGHVGTKEGCAEGDCGACTIAVVAQDDQGHAQFQAVNSCLMPLGALAGQTAITVEGVAPDANVRELASLHPVQRAMVETGGSQCGYCTPGFIMSMFSAYYRGEVTDEDIEGNLCRCTGYAPIRRAMAQLSKPSADDPFVKMLEAASNDKDNAASTVEVTDVEVTDTVNVTDRGYLVPQTLADAFAILTAQPDATIIAGATDLGVDINHDRLTSETLLSVEHIPELQTLDVTEDAVTIGAGVTLSRLEHLNIFPALSEMISWFASRQIRNRATIGGNIATASPIGDLPPVLLAYDATLTIANVNGTRTLPLADFFQGYRQTALTSGDIISHVTIPRHKTPAASTRLSQSYKVGKRGTDDISIVAAAFCIDLDATNTIVHARLAYGGVAATPARACEVETWLVGKPWQASTIQDAKARLKDAFTPLTDVRGSAAYRKLLVANLFEKFFVETNTQLEEVLA